MRSKTAIALAILGLLLLGLGIGQRTLWLPPDTVTASVAQGAKSAPVTVVDSGVRTLHGIPVTLHVKSAGPIVLVAGRSDDVDAWVGKAAHLSVTGADSDYKTLTTTSTEGEATVPNPTGSDLWTQQETASGELRYQWTPPADGNWSLLIASDGTAAAPTDISLTAPNDTDTPWAVPLMVIGALILVAGVLMLLFRPKRGRRSLVGTPATGTRSGKTASRSVSRSTDARAGGPVDGPAVAPAEKSADKPAGQPDEKPVDRPADKSKGESGKSLFAGRAPLTAAVAALLLTGTVVPAASAATTPPSSDTGSASPSAATSGSPSPSSSGTGTAMADASAPAEVPVLLDGQFSRILDAVANTVAGGDAAKDAGKLQDRVSGSALELRGANYRIRSQVADYPAVTPVASSKLLTKVVSTSRSWPRTVMAVTQGGDNPVPQLLTLVQNTPRDPYRLDQATPLLPGQTFPGVDKKGAGTLAMDDKTALQMSPDVALAALSDRLTKSDSQWKDKITDPVYIPDVDSYKADIAAKGPDATYAFSHTPVPGTGRVLRTADGGALVIADVHFNVDATSQAEAKLTVGADAAVFAGGTETTKGFVLNFGEPVVLYVPPAGSTGNMILLSATRGLIGASFK
ncbi:hypothetical protein [Paenarthrobacter sp. PH39-S1]|uniref:hypothetical protein n=1 Tax=Paenarthrobacter sp. PH39-S1 TaxID=3046204 RepID=UPI0024BB57C7|nr:hypothetical protein [Paenarthrobacter sp. PH39-S1]MDJ0357189.1 hypothetical protein [Paenarthrobacter sp. PH39-S1]